MTAGRSSEPAHALHSMLLEQQQPTPDLRQGHRVLTIRTADSDGHRSSAHILVNRMYSGRGYTHSARMPERRNPNHVTLIGSDHDVTVGTITIGFDDGAGLLVDECFSDHVERLRGEGMVLCEFIKLAIDSVSQSKHMLASLFHTAFIYAHEIKCCDKIVIEVNPRHVRFYEAMLGFSVLTESRLNHRVNAPAVLMALDLQYANEQIRQVTSEAPEGRSKRSMYNHCFSREEMAAIIGRLHVNGAG